MFRKIGLFLLGIITVFGFNFQFAWGLHLRDHFNNYWSQGKEIKSDPTIDGTLIDDKDPTSQGITAISNESIGILHLPQPGNYETKLGYAISLVQIIINRILRILATVVLVYILYKGFLVISAGDDDKGISKGKTGIKNAAIAIAGILLAWLIISAMIWFIKIITDTNI